MTISPDRSTPPNGIDTPAGTPTETPDRILAYLHEHGETSAPGISRGLGGPTPKIITKHLRRLALAGLVEQDGVRWGVSFAGLSTLPGSDDEDAITTAAVTAEMDFAGEVELAIRLVKRAISSLGKPKTDDAQSALLRGRLSIAEQKLAGATPRNFRAICTALRPVVQEALELQASRGQVIDARTRLGGPNNAGALADVSRRQDTPAKTFLRHGFVAEMPAPGAYRSPLGRRYQSTVAGCGAVIWEGSQWADPEVEAVRQAIIRAATAVDPLSALGD